MQEISSKISYSISGGTALFGLSVNEWVAIVGAACAVGTFIVNWIYKRKYFNLALDASLQKGNQDEKKDH